MSRPRLLDLFCKAGGAGFGYSLAGFDVVGIDHEPQPNYPFEFHKADALEYATAHGREFDAIHASPPCQKHSKAQKIMGRYHVDLIVPTREVLRGIAALHVIENVPGAPLDNPVLLVGTMFGLGTMRPRLFECHGFTVPFQLMPPMPVKQTKMGRKPKDGEFMQVVGHFSDVDRARTAMGIDWMTGRELAQAIPPAYCEFIGRHLLAALAVTN